MINIALIILVILTAGSVGAFIHWKFKALRSELSKLNAVILQDADQRFNQITAFIDMRHAALDSAFADAGSKLANTDAKILSYLETHNAELKANADRLRAHAQAMHDEAQARVISRPVPMRGQ